MLEMILYSFLIVQAVFSAFSHVLRLYALLWCFPFLFPAWIALSRAKRFAVSKRSVLLKKVVKKSEKNTSILVDFVSLMEVCQKVLNYFPHSKISKHPHFPVLSHTFQPKHLHQKLSL